MSPAPPPPASSVPPPEETGENPPPPEAVTRLELCLASIVFLAVLALRLRYLFVCRFDTDEAQHLHVVWGWTVHLLPYRDFFDNHVPLFHILFAPVLRLFPERPDILIVMRFTMIPLWLGSVWCLYLTGKRAFGPRAGLWAAVLATSSARFFFKMGEFRTDVLWTFLWFLAIAILAGGRFSARRAFAAGLVLGTALAVSLKTSIMLVALAPAAIVIFLVARRHGLRPAASAILGSLAAALAGLLAVPALVAGYFASEGALGLMYRCVIAHNALPAGPASAGVSARVIPLLLSLLTGCAAIAVAFAVAKRSRDLSVALKRLAVVLPMAGYYITIRFFWPVVTAQDYAPLDPLFFLCVTPLLILAGRSLAARWPAGPIQLAAVCLLLGFNFCQMFMAENPLKNATGPDVAMVRDVLKLTKPGEEIMDAKGETIYRPRAYYYVLETLTLKRMGLGLLPDDIVPTLMSRRPPVFHGAARMSEADQKWERANYVNIGTLDVLGKLLPKQESGPFAFQIVVPEEYAVVANRGTVEGSLDGQPLIGPRPLAAGPHEFVPAHPEPGQRFAVVWARAAGNAYSPFPKGSGK